jgi:hypothetical protein
MVTLPNIIFLVWAPAQLAPDDSKNLTGAIWFVKEKFPFYGEKQKLQTSSGPTQGLDFGELGRAEN